MTGTHDTVHAGAYYKVRRRHNASSEGIQVIGLDVGSEGSESLVTAANPLPVSVYSGLVPEIYDYISLSYTGTDLTGVVYKTGGSGGTTVATLVLGYSGGNLVSVAKT